MPSVPRRHCAGACDIADPDPVGDSHADPVGHGVADDDALPESISQRNRDPVPLPDAFAAVDVKLYSYHDNFTHRDRDAVAATDPVSHTDRIPVVKSNPIAVRVEWPDAYANGVPGGRARGATEIARTCTCCGLRVLFSGADALGDCHGDADGIDDQDAVAVVYAIDIADAVIDAHAVRVPDGDGERHPDAVVFVIRLRVRVPVRVRLSDALPGGDAHDDSVSRRYPDADDVDGVHQVPDANAEPVEISNQVADAHCLKFSDQDASIHGIADDFWNADP